MLATCPISLGEFWDKFTIVEVKMAQVKDPMRRKHIAFEYMVMKAASEGLPQAHVDEIKALNKEIWDVENKIRQCVRDSDFGEEYIAGTKKTIELNDKRAALKRQIDIDTGSSLIWEKEHV